MEKGIELGEIDIYEGRKLYFSSLSGYLGGKKEGEDGHSSLYVGNRNPNSSITRRSNSIGK